MLKKDASRLKSSFVLLFLVLFFSASCTTRLFYKCCDFMELVKCIQVLLKRGFINIDLYKRRM